MHDDEPELVDLNLAAAVRPPTHMPTVLSTIADEVASSAVTIGKQSAASLCWLCCKVCPLLISLRWVWVRFRMVSGVWSRTFLTSTYRATH